MAVSEQEGIESPGWDAIDTALQSLYAGQEPKHYGNLIAYELGGPNPLRGISAYRRETPRPHWHFVTYGFSELYKKKWDDPAISGFGFELTFRLADNRDETDPPQWAINFLHNIARYVFDSGNGFRSGHYMNLNGPIALEEQTLICSMAFIDDPELSAIQSPNGSLEFLQVVGITSDEEFALKRWSTLKTLEIFSPHLPLYITDLARDSLLQDTSIAEQVREGSARDGSSTGSLFIDQLGWIRQKRMLRKPLVEITIGARQVGEIVALLPLRLLFGKSLTLAGDEACVIFQLGSTNSAEEVDGVIELRLDEKNCHELTHSLRPIAAEYVLRGFEGVVFRVCKTEIRDSEGQIVRVIG